ncbi:MAG TPA: hypothetical protein VGD90_11915 [Sphingobacteriaceae bacterium]
MKKVSLGKGVVILLVGLMGASCTKDVQEEPFETTPVTAPADSVPANAAPSEAAPAAPAPAPASAPAVPAPAAPAPAPQSTAPAPAASTASSIGTPIGFAAENGMTTGGQGGSEVTVSTLAELKTAAASASPMIINVSGNITGSTGVKVSSNKTIIGLSGSKLDGVGLLMNGVSNIIVKNMTIVNPSATDAISIRSKSHHIWVDHCTLDNPKFDGLLDITDQSDYVTVSWSKLSNASKNSLVGSSETSVADKGKLNVTYHHNHFLNNLERSPSLSFGTGHVFNNYYQHTKTMTNGYGIASRMGATVYAENNYFDGIKGSPIATIGTQYGFVGGESTNVFKNSGANKIRTAASTWVPAYAYKSALIAAENVPATVMAGAGAR